MDCNKRSWSKCADDDCLLTKSSAKRKSYCRKYTRGNRKSKSACRGRAERFCNEKGVCVYTKGSKRNFCRKVSNKRKTRK
jgi:hypothetical protein